MADRVRARLLVRYGRYREGDEIEGRVAEHLIKSGQAVPVKARPAKAKPAKKSLGAAPENKATKE